MVHKKGKILQIKWNEFNLNLNILKKCLPAGIPPYLPVDNTYTIIKNEPHLCKKITIL